MFYKLLTSLLLYIEKQLNHNYYLFITIQNECLIMKLFTKNESFSFQNKCGIWFDHSGAVK